MQIASFAFHFVSLCNQILCPTGTGRRYSIAEFGSDSLNAVEQADFPHHFIKHRGNNSAMNEARCALILRADAKRTADSSGSIILLKRKVHAV